jgi:nucleoside-diphosphate-sugar epimerase
MSKRALVTGGCGFIGSNLVHKLVELGWTVDVVDDMSNGRVEFLEGVNFRAVPGFLLDQYEEKYELSREGQVLVVEADMETPGILKRISAGKYDTVFHLAANPRVEYTAQHPAATTDVNCTRTISLLEAVQASPIPVRFVFSSTCAVYGDAAVPTDESAEKVPLSPYGLQKSYVEDYIRIANRLHGLDAVCLRYFNVYGPRQVADSAYATAITAWCNRVKEGKPLRSDGDGEQSRDMVFVGDIVRANILAATRVENFNGERINIGAGERFTNNRILGMFRERFKDVEIVHAPPRPGDVRHTLSDIRYAREQLGYVPQTKFEDGLRLTWEWWGL